MSDRPRDVAAPADSVRRYTPAHRKLHPRWRRQAAYFVVRWEQAALEHPELRRVRALDTLNHCRTYMGVHFEGHTEEEVRGLIDDFVTKVTAGELVVKPPQSAWMRFTGTWGR